MSHCMHQPDKLTMHGIAAVHCTAEHWLSELYCDGLAVMQLPFLSPRWFLLDQHRLQRVGCKTWWCLGRWGLYKVELADVSAATLPPWVWPT